MQSYSISYLKKVAIIALFIGIALGVFFTKMSTQNKLIEQMVSKQVARDELNVKQDAIDKDSFKDVIVGNGRKY